QQATTSVLLSPLHVHRAACAFGVIAVALSGACTPKDRTAPSPDAAASGPTSATASAEAPSIPASPGGDEIRPAYPLTLPPHPQAVRLCEALHDLPEKRKAECCADQPRFTITSECIRTLSFAIQERSVTLDAADVDRCVEALNKTYEGCGWVGPNAVRVPAACR